MVKQPKKEYVLKSRIDWSNKKNCDRLTFVVLHFCRHLSAKELARKTGLSQYYIYKLRQGPAYGGPRWPKMHTMRLMLQAVGLTLGEAEKEAERLGMRLDKIAACPPEIAPKRPRKRAKHINITERKQKQTPIIIRQMITH